MHPGARSLCVRRGRPPVSTSARAGMQTRPPPPRQPTPHVRREPVRCSARLIHQDGVSAGRGSCPAQGAGFYSVGTAPGSRPSPGLGSCSRGVDRGAGLPEKSEVGSTPLGPRGSRGAGGGGGGRRQRGGRVDRGEASARRRRVRAEVSARAAATRELGPGLLPVAFHRTRVLRPRRHATENVLPATAPRPPGKRFCRLPGRGRCAADTLAAGRAAGGPRDGAVTREGPEDTGGRPLGPAGGDESEKHPGC